MGSNDEEDHDIYQVIDNGEELYSIWPADREVPARWNAEGTRGTKAECLARIEAMWNEIHPPSLRKKADEPGRAGKGGGGDDAGD